MANRNVISVESFSDALAEERSWRLRELDALKSAVVKENRTPKRFDHFARAGIVLCYAHWEGFIKRATQAYLDHISQQRIDLSKLRPGFVSIALCYKLGHSSSKQLDRFMPIIETLSNDGHFYSGRRAVDTEDNLSSAVFKKILGAIYIPQSDFESEYSFIDKRLVGVRNSIAHGEKFPILAEQFIEAADRTLGMMDQFRNLLENAAVLKAYHA